MSEEIRELRKRLRTVERELAHTQRARLTAEQLVERHQRVLSQAHTELRQTLDDLVATQSRLVEAEKTASMGRFVAGVAHELNNPMAMIGAAAQQLGSVTEDTVRDLPQLLQRVPPAALQRWTPRPTTADLDDPRVQRRHRRRLRRQLEDEGQDPREWVVDGLADLGFDVLTPEQVDAVATDEGLAALRLMVRLTAMRRSLSIVREGVHRSAALVTALKQCARSTRSPRQTREEVLPRITAVLRDLDLPPSVYTDISGDDGQVEAHHPELDDVWRHLIHNAAQAMDHDGELSVVVTSLEDALVVTVTDEGCGIPQELRGRVFDPFFTTRKVGEGKGLGLSMCQEIVRSHGGLIHFTSEEGRTTFVVELPLAGHPPLASLAWAEGASHRPVLRPAGPRSGGPTPITPGINAETLDTGSATPTG